LKILYIRSDTYDITPAIPRGLKAAESVFNESIVLCWNRGDTKPRSIDTKQTNLFIFKKTTKHKSLYNLIITLHFQFWAFKKMMQYDYDVIQALDIESMLPAAFASLIRRKKLIYDIRDPIAMDMKSPSHLLNINGSIIGNILDKCIYGVDWLLMSFSSGYILPNKLLIKYLGRWGRNTQKILSIPNTCDDYYQELENSKLKLINQSPKVLRLAYLGCMGNDRGSKFLIEFCNKNIGSVELLIAGIVRDRNDLINFENTPNIIYLGQLNYIEALSLIKQVDALPILYNPNVKLHKMLYPTKFYESMMVGTPVLVSKGMTALEEEVISKKVGYVIDYGDVVQLKDALEKIKFNEDKLTSNCRKYYLRELQLSQFLINYRNFYRSISN